MHDYRKFLEEFEQFKMHARQLFEERVYTDAGDGSANSGEWTPAVDVYETADTIVLTAEVAGVRRQEMTIEVQDNVLTLRGSRLPGRTGVAPESYVRMEVPFGTFERTFTLPCAVAEDRIEARLRNGVLTVTVPRLSASPGRRILVQT